MSRQWIPEQARERAARRREAKARGGFTPLKPPTAQANNQHGTNPCARRAQRDGERKAYG